MFFFVMCTAGDMVWAIAENDIFIDLQIWCNNCNNAQEILQRVTKTWRTFHKEKSLKMSNKKDEHWRKK